MSITFFKKFSGKADSAGLNGAKDLGFSLQGGWLLWTNQAEEHFGLRMLIRYFPRSIY